MFLLYLTLAFLPSILGQSSNQCGISSNTKLFDGSDQTRILGGKKSNPSDWPFVVQIKSKGICTGSIIGNRWILCAAHCDPINGFVTVVLANGKKYESELIINHERYVNSANDIMLIKLREPLQFSKNVSQVCLFRNVTVASGDIAAVTGFGEIFESVKNFDVTIHKERLDLEDLNFKEPTALYETPLIIQDPDYCSLNPQNRLQICAGGVLKGTTRGDSGGPLLVVRNQRWVQVGVTSQGFYKPIQNDVTQISDRGIYTRVSEYCDWIEQKTSGEVKCQ